MEHGEKIKALSSGPDHKTDPRKPR